MKPNNYFLKLFTVTLFLISAACFGQLKTVVQFGHKNPMTEIVISNDGKIIASTDGEVIKLWDIKTGLEFKTLFIGEGRIYPITNIQFVPGNSSYVLSYFFNRKLIYQNVLTSEVEIHNEDLKDQNDTLTKQEKLEIKFADRNTNVKMMDEYLSELAKIEENSLEIWEKFNQGVSYSDITFSENGKCKLTKRIGKFEKKEIEPYEDKSKKFKSLNSKLDPQKKKNKVEYTGRKYPYVIVPQEDETKTILDYYIDSKKDPVLSINLDRTISNAADIAQNSLSISPNGQFGCDGPVLLSLNAGKTKKQRTIIGLLRDQEKIRSTVFSEDSKYLIVGYNNSNSIKGNLEIYNLSALPLEYKTKDEVLYDTTFTLYPEASFDCNAVNKIQTSYDSTHFICIHSNNTISYWDLKNKAEVPNYFNALTNDHSIVPLEKINTVAINKTVGTLVIGGGSKSNPNSTIKIWDLKTGLLGNEFGLKMPPAELTARSFNGDTLMADMWESGYNLKKNLLSPSEVKNKWYLGEKNLNLCDLTIDSKMLVENKIYSNDLTKSLGSADGLTVIYDEKNSGSKTILKGSNEYTGFVLSKDNNFVVGFHMSTVSIWNAIDGSLKNSLPIQDTITEVNISDNSTTVCILTNTRKVFVWNFLSNQFGEFTLPGWSKSEKAFKRYASELIEMGYSGISVELADLMEEIKIIKSLPTTPFQGVKKIKKGLDIIKEQEHRQHIRDSIAIQREKLFTNIFSNQIEISPDGKKVLIMSENGYEILVYNLDSTKTADKKMAKLFDKSYAIRQVGYKLAIGFIPYDTTTLYNLARNKIKQLALKNNIANYYSIDNNWTKVAFIENPRGKNRQIKVYDLENMEKFELPKESIPIGKPYISPSGRYVAASSVSQNYEVIRIWDLSTRKICKTIVGHSGSLLFSNDEKFLISSGSDLQIKVWDISDENKVVVNSPSICYLATKMDDDYMIYTDDGYYLSTKGNRDAIAFQLGNKAYPIEQFDFFRSRPDTLSDKILQISSKQCQEYNPVFKAFQKIRNNSITIKESDYTQNINSILPTIEITNTDSSSSISSNFALHLKGNSPGDSKLKKLNIYINNVPVFDMSGLSVLPTNTIDTTVNIPLNLGKNQIKVNVENTAGYQSVSDYYSVKYVSKSKIKPKLYLVAIGVDNYNITGIKNLNNSVKDCNKIISLFQNEKLKYNEYDSIITFLYPNESATIDKIKECRQAIKNANVNDELIVYFAGHGKLNTNSEFCFLTYNTDLNNNFANSWTNSDIHYFFATFPMRKKLIILDACASGDLLKGREIRSVKKDSDKIISYTKRYFELYLNYNNSGIETIASTMGLQEAEDGIFANAFEKVMNNNASTIKLNSIKKELKSEILKQTNSSQEICFTNENPAQKWMLRGKSLSE